MGYHSLFIAYDLLDDWSSEELGLTLMSFTIRFEPSEEVERDPDIEIVSKMYWKPQSVQRRSKG